MDKVELNEEEQRKLDLLYEEFDAIGGMDDDEIIARLCGVVPFDEFMEKLRIEIEKIYDLHK